MSSIRDQAAISSNNNSRRPQTSTAAAAATTTQPTSTTRIYSSRGIDGLNRLERRNLAIYNRTQYLFDKFLASRKAAQTLELTHEHILGIIHKTIINN